VSRGHATVFTVDERVALGQAIRNRREVMGLTRAQFAEIAGVSGQFLGAIEKGHKAPSQERLTEMCRHLDVQPEVLLAQSRAKEGEEMVTGYEVQMYNDINAISRSLNRIANCMEAAEKRARGDVAPKPTTPEDMADVGDVIRHIVREFKQMTEQRAQEAGEDQT